MRLSTAAPVRRRAAAAAVGLVVAVALVACGSSSGSAGGSAMTGMGGTAAATSAKPVEGTAIEIKSFEYSPQVLQVKVGTTITITNKDAVGHSVTTKAGAPEAYDSGVFTTGTKTWTPTVPGTYQYYCSVHSYMLGTVVVTS